MNHQAKDPLTLGDDPLASGYPRNRPFTIRTASSQRVDNLYSSTPSVTSLSSRRPAGDGDGRDSPNGVQIMYDLPAGMASPPARSPPPVRPRPGGMMSTGVDVPTRVRSPVTAGSSRLYGARSLHEGSRSRRGSTDSGQRPPLGPRRSSEYSLPPPMVRTQSDQSGRATPKVPSVFSVRSQSYYTLRDGVPSPKPAQLHLFAHHCRLLYFSETPQPVSENHIDLALAGHNPAAHRSVYLQVQAACRALAHLHKLRMRISSFHAHIAGMSPTGSLTPHSRSDLAGPAAQLERKERLREFIKDWCLAHSGMEPLFRGLWGVLRAQSRGGPERGGAGDRRVVWEIDDAVFMESGGMEFMRQALEIIKGVLGFEDQALTAPPKIKRVRSLSRRYSETLSRQSRTPTFPRSNASSPLKPTEPARRYDSHQPVEELLSLSRDSSSHNLATISAGTGTATWATQAQADANRTRAGSDPFTDPKGSPAKPRSTSGRGPAPPPPQPRKTSAGRRAGLAVPIPNPLQPSTTTPLSAASFAPSLLSPSCQTDTSSHIDSPLLPHQDAEPSPIVAALENAAAQDSGPAALRRPDVPLQDPSETEALLSGSREPKCRNPNGLVVGLGVYGDSAIAEETADDEDDYEDFDSPTLPEIRAEEARLSEDPRCRLWTVPAHLTNEHIEGLLALFPAFIRRGQGRKSVRAAQDVRFPFVRPGRGLKALESGVGGIGGMGDDPGWEPVFVDFKLVARVPREEVEVEEGAVRHGTGRMWVGLEPRDSGWEGGRFFRFCRWWRRLFGIGLA